MQKVIILLLVAISITSCSVLKKEQESALMIEKIKIKNIENIRRKNLSENGFSLSKVEILIEENGEKQRLLGNIRYQKSGKFLISLKNSTGIEGVRIYIDKDTVLANDRINKKLYYGSATELYKKYGISMNYLPVLLGDLVVEESSMNKEIKCEKGIAEIVESIKEREIKYFVDCDKDKIIKTELLKNPEKDQIDMKFTSFKRSNDLYYPEIIEINDSFNGTKISIEVRKAEKYTRPELMFVPGSNYELILLK